ncbi:MAG: His-Xaa-Ser system radical SAM maturase HxsB [Afipia sp.]|nr:His-Xaa-Ser system radical SAM maturase HxsB [Afipia sp.]
MSELANSLEAYQLMPFRFRRLERTPDTVLVTSEAGEHAFLDESSFNQLVNLKPLNLGIADDLDARQILCRDDRSLAVRLLATKLRTRKSFLRHGPSLHIFVVTLSCDHSCAYCQVSRRIGSAEMPEGVAVAAVERMFESPSPDLTVEFQGGEPLLAFDRISQIVRLIEARNVDGRRRIRYTLTSTLHHLDERALQFLQHYNFHVSTSLDGPANLHNGNRPLPTRDSHTRTLEGIAKARAALGIDGVAALTTLTKASLEQPEAIVDEYVRLGFRSVFLRPLSPFGFAARAARRMEYGTSAFLTFYERALGHVLDLNARGVEIEEVYTAILLKSIFTSYSTGYVDLRSPVGAGFGTLVYNYDGDVYASDEGRMLAEMGDNSLRMGSVQDFYRDLIDSDAMHLLAASGLAESLPGCADCAFVHYCGPDPARSLSSAGEPAGHRAWSDHCGRHTGIFELLFGIVRKANPATMRTFDRWVHGSPGVDRAECA